MVDDYYSPVMISLKEILVSYLNKEFIVKSQIRICMIGAGRVGKNHSRAITRHVPGGKIVALVDPMVSVRNETALEFGIECAV